MTLSGGEFNPEPIRLSYTAGSLRLTAASFAIGPNLSSGVSGDLSAILDNLFASEAIVDSQGRPTRRFQQVWENTITGIKEILTSQGLSIAELQAIYAGINAAQATATQAVQQTQAIEEQRALADSYTNPVGVATAASSGTVTIDAHERVYVYSDGSEAIVSVSGGSVSGFSPGDYVTVYYSDPARAGGAVSYQGTANAVAQTGDTHIVSQVLVPQIGAAATPGSGPTAPGWKAEYYIDPRAYGYDV